MTQILIAYEWNVVARFGEGVAILRLMTARSLVFGELESCLQYVA